MAAPVVVLQLMVVLVVAVSAAAAVLPVPVLAVVVGSLGKQPPLASAFASGCPALGSCEARLLTFTILSPAFFFGE